MDRIHHPSASASPPPVDAHGTSGYPTDGDPLAGIEATIFTAYMGHALIEEQRNVVLGMGIAPDKADLAQVHQALLRAAAANVSIVSADTMLTADDAGLVEIAISANRTITLPAAASAGGRPLRFLFVRTDTTASTATVQRASADTIEGGTSITVPVAGRVTLVSDGVSAWRVVGEVARGRSINNPGYTRLPGGLILQWTNNLTVSTDGSGQGSWNWTYPVAFPNAALAVFASPMHLGTVINTPQVTVTGITAGGAAMVGRGYPTSGTGALSAFAIGW